MSIVDPDITAEYIQGIDLEIARMIPDENGSFIVGEVIGNWNTSETDAITFTTEETFNSLDDTIYFGFKFNEVPEKYEEELSYLRESLIHDSDGNRFCDGYYVYSKNAKSVRRRSENFGFVWKKSGDKYITTLPTTTKSHTTTTTTAKAPSGVKPAGDANGDNQLNVADAVFIMQFLSNPNEYILTPENASSADIVNKGDGVTAIDALAIQMIGIGLLTASDLPVTSAQLNNIIS